MSPRPRGSYSGQVLTDRGAWSVGPGNDAGQDVYGLVLHQEVHHLLKEHHSSCLGTVCQRGIQQISTEAIKSLFDHAPCYSPVSIKLTAPVTLVPLLHKHSTDNFVFE